MNRTRKHVLASALTLRMTTSAVRLATLGLDFPVCAAKNHLLLIRRDVIPTHK